MEGSAMEGSAMEGSEMEGSAMEGSEMEGSEVSGSQEVLRIMADAPAARKALQDNYSNLRNVADYCYNNYIQSGEGSLRALEETKQFTTQSLASVAYQISQLAASVLGLLDAQSSQLAHMEASVNTITQTVEMHKEKVSRREIGAFTSVRRVPRSHRILPPDSPTAAKARLQYTRKPINYQQLDGIGHGVKVSGKQERTGTIRKHGSIRSNKPPEPVQCPVAPPVSGSSFGIAVAPPTIPPANEAPPEYDIITSLLDEAPPPPPPSNEMTVNEMPALDDDVTTLVPPPPPLPTNQSAPPPAPPLALETVVEESSFPPPLCDESSFTTSTNENAELPAPPPPPPDQEVDVLRSSRTLRGCLSPSARSLSLRARSGPAARHTRSLYLPAGQALMIPPPPAYPPPNAPPSSRPSLPARLQHLDLELPATPPPFLLDDEISFYDIMPPPADYHDTDVPPEYLEKVVALYSYEASKPDDLSLKEGDVIFLTHRHADGWCEGVLHGNRGFFPDNYVESCD